MAPANHPVYRSNNDPAAHSQLPRLHGIFLDVSTIPRNGYQLQPSISTFAVYPQLPTFSAPSQIQPIPCSAPFLSPTSSIIHLQPESAIQVQTAQMIQTVPSNQPLHVFQQIQPIPIQGFLPILRVKTTSPAQNGTAPKESSPTTPVLKHHNDARRFTRRRWAETQAQGSELPRYVPAPHCHSPQHQGIKFLSETD